MFLASRFSPLSRREISGNLRNFLAVKIVAGALGIFCSPVRWGVSPAKRKGTGSMHIRSIRCLSFCLPLEMRPSFHDEGIKNSRENPDLHSIALKSTCVLYTSTHSFCQSFLNPSLPGCSRYIPGRALKTRPAGRTQRLGSGPSYGIF